MGNLIGVMLHCRQKGQAAIIGKQSHIRRWERANISAIAGVFPLTVDNQQDGSIDIQDIEGLLEDCKDSEVDSHIMKVQLICLESSQNYCGGKVLSIDYLQEVKKVANKYGLKMHLDGARLLNGCSYLGIEPK